jgi:hypothetical protein
MALLGACLALFSAHPAFLQAAPRPDPFTDFCNSLVDSVLKRVNSAREGPIGVHAFEKEVRLIFERHLSKSVPELGPDYLEQNYREWVDLGDPAFHLAVLKYPVPEAAVEALGSALVNRITPEQISRMLQGFRGKGTPREILIWIQRLLEHPERRDGNLLHALVNTYKNTMVMTHDRIRYLTGIPVLPEVKPGHVRMYKGSNFFKGPARSQSQVGKPLEEVGDGGIVFLDQSDANTHSVKAEAFHPDGVSISTDKTVPINYGSHIRIYDVPMHIVDRLPRGAPGLSEYVFRYSIPERFRIATYPKATYLEILKQEVLRISGFGDLARGFARNSGMSLMGLLHSRAEPILVRGRSYTFSGLMGERIPLFERNTIEHQTLLGLEQLEKHGSFFYGTPLKAPPNVDLRSTVTFSFVLRHIGKPIASAIDASFKEITVEVVGQMMRKAGYSKAEVDLGQALTGNDVIGSMLRGEISPHEAFEELVRISRQTNLTPLHFFRVQAFFHAMDAIANPDRAPLFIKEGGMVIPASSRFVVLRNLFENVEIKP